MAAFYTIDYDRHGNRTVGRISADTLEECVRRVQRAFAAGVVTYLTEIAWS